MANLESVKRIVDKTLECYDSDTQLIREYRVTNYHSNLKPGEYCFINSSTNYKRK